MIQEILIYTGIVIAEVILLMLLFFVVFRNEKVQKTFGKLFTFLGKVQSENGQPSQARFNNFYAVTILIPCIAFVLIYVTIVYENLLEFVLTSILAFIFGLFGLKVYQKKTEEPTTNPEQK